MKYMVETHALTKKYGNSFALDSISLNFAAEKTHALLGSSGSGKTTLLRAILGTIECDSGSVLIDGQPVHSLSAWTRSELIGYVPQDAGLFPHLTARQNITLVSRSLRWSADRVDARLLDLQEIAPLNEALLSKYPSELSGGQKQRVAVLRALFLDPKLVLMDEPFAALDPLVRADVQSEIRDLFIRLKKTVILVTHDVGEASYLGDNIVLMHKGQVIQQGHLRDLAEKPASDFVTKFLNAQRVFSTAN